MYWKDCVCFATLLYIFLFINSLTERCDKHHKIDFALIAQKFLKRQFAVAPLFVSAPMW
jgi:hypothetical protein